MREYMTWAVDRVLTHEDRDQVPPGLAVPQWDWDGPVTR